MTPPAAAVTYQALESDSAKHVLLVCPACLRMLQIRPLSVGKTGHCVHCRSSLRAISDGKGGVLAVSMTAIGAGMAEPSNGAREMLALSLSNDVPGFHEPTEVTNRPTFASSASIPSRWGFPARELDEDPPVDFAPPGFAEALFGQGNLSMEVEGLDTRSDGAGTSESGLDKYPGGNLGLGPATAGQVGLAWPKPLSVPDKIGKTFKISGMVLAITCLGYAAFRFSPTPLPGEWRARARAWLFDSTDTGTDLSGQNTEAAQR